MRIKRSQVKLTLNQLVNRYHTLKRQLVNYPESKDMLEPMIKNTEILIIEYVTNPCFANKIKQLDL